MQKLYTITCTYPETNRFSLTGLHQIKDLPYSISMMNDSENMTIDAFFHKDATRGILRVRNLLTGRCYLTKSEDFVKSLKDIRFSLDLGFFENDELQKDYEETGLELFSIESVFVAENGEDLDPLLEKYTSEYREKNIPLY